MVAGTPWKRGSRFTRVNSGSFQQGSRRMLKGANRRISRTELDEAHRYLVCGTLRKCSAGVRRGPYSWVSRDGRSDAQEPDKETLLEHYPAAPGVGLQDRLGTTRTGLFSDVRFIAGPLSRDVAAPEYFCATPFYLVESTGRTARTGRVREHGARATIYRGPSSGATVARTDSPRG